MEKSIEISPEALADAECPCEIVTCPLNSQGDDGEAARFVHAQVFADCALLIRREQHVSRQGGGAAVERADVFE